MISSSDFLFSFFFISFEHKNKEFIKLVNSYLLLVSGSKHPFIKSNNALFVIFSFILSKFIFILNIKYYLYKLKEIEINKEIERLNLIKEENFVKIQY